VAEIGEQPEIEVEIVEEVPAVDTTDDTAADEI
jgi:hypothetical protein